VNTNGHFGLYYNNAYKIKKSISGITVLSKYLNYSPSSDIAKPFDIAGMIVVQERYIEGPVVKSLTMKQMIDIHKQIFKF
jgi:hypothetical protein